MEERRPIRTVIFAPQSHMKSGIRKFEEIVNSFDDEEIELVRRKPRHNLILKNGDDFILVPANDSARGFRYTKAFVHLKTDEEYLNSVIRAYSLDWEEDIEFYE